MDLWKRLAVEFSDETARKQMKWEREDRILEEDWPANDWGTLAVRYANACDRVPGMHLRNG